MGRFGANAPLLLGWIAIAGGGASAQTLPYDPDAVADRLPYALDQLPAEETPFDPAADEGALTVLGVIINDRDLSDSTIMTVRGGAAMVPVDDLRRWRVLTSGSGATDIDGQQFVPLASVRGLSFRVDSGRQMLVLDIPVASFERTALSAGTAPPAASPAAKAAFFNYDLSFERSSGKTIAGAFLEMGASNDSGLLTNTMLVSSGGNQKTVVRLDTYAIHDDPSGLTRLVVGDTLTRGSSWAPQTRFAGIRFGTDFSLQPGFLSFPTPTFDGQAAIPSNVEVFVNDVLRYQTQVDQGPFALNQLPLLTGAGKVALRVNDGLGIQRTVLVDYYVSTRLLREGLADYSVEGGAERQSYGFRSFDYTRPFAAATHRYGLTRWLTTEARVEMSRDLQMIGGGAAMTAGQIGEVGFAVAGSNSPDGAGALYRVFAARISPRWSVSASYQNSTRKFAELGRVGISDRPLETLQLNAGVSLGRWGNLNASESFIRRLNDDKIRVTTVNYGRRLGRSANLSAFLINSRASGLPDLTTVGLSFSMSIGAQTTLYAQADSDGHRAEINKALPSDRGWGYRLLVNDSQTSQQEAGLSYRGRAIEVSGQAVRTGGSTGLRVLANGGFLLAEGSVFPTQRLDSGFAIVDANGQPGVRVFQDNREVTRTNDRGVAIVTQLRPYESNRISVATDDLKLDTAIQNDTLVLVPRLLGGVNAKFTVSDGHAGTVVIERPDGNPLEPGTPITIDAGPAGTFAGYGGEVFLDTVAEGMTLTAARNEGPCYVTLPAIPADETLPRIGPLRCSVDKK